MPWLAAVGAWIARLVGGWLPLGNKPIGEWLGKIVWVVGIIFVCLLVWNKFTKPTTTTATNQKADTISNYTYAPKVGFGCIRMEKLREKDGIPQETLQVK